MVKAWKRCASMGYLRISMSPAEWARLNPSARRDFHAMNAEADRLDPLTRPDREADEREVEEDWTRDQRRI